MSSYRRLENIHLTHFWGPVGFHIGPCSVALKTEVGEGHQVKYFSMTKPHNILHFGFRPKCNYMLEMRYLLARINPI